MSREIDDKTIQDAIDKAKTGTGAVEPIAPPKPEVTRPTWEQIKNSMAGKTLDDFALKLTNLALFSKSDVKMDDVHCVGSSILYTICYYFPQLSIAADHPLAVVAICGFMFGTDLVNKYTESKKPKTPQHPLEA